MTSPTGHARFLALLATTFLLRFPCAAQESGAARGPYFGQTPPGKTPVLFAPFLFTDPGEYHSPVVFSPDGKVVYWTPMPGHGRNTTLTSSMKGGVWTPPRYEDFGLSVGATEVTFSPDGRTIFFLSRQRLDGEPSEEADRRPAERIWYASRTPDGRVGTPRLMPPTVTTRFTHWQFSVAANGNLYFSSSRPGGGAADIFQAPFDGHTWLEPRPLGPGINGAATEHCPWVAPDESYLIFTRDEGDGSNADLFISYREPDGSWGRASPLPPPINSGSNEIYPVISPDRKYLFFLSWREGAGRIFWVEADFLYRRRP